MTRLIPWITQGRVIAIDEKLSATGNKLIHVKLLTINGNEDYFLSWGNEPNFEQGDVIRAVASKQRPEPGQFTADQDGLVAPNIFNVANLGDVAIDSDKRSHYEFGEVIKGEVVKDLGSRFCMDWDWNFSRIKLEDGSSLNVTTPHNRLRVGTYVQGKVGNSMFKDEAELTYPPRGFSLGFGNLGGMTLLTEVIEVERPLPTAAVQPLRYEPPQPKKRSILERIFG